MRRLQSILAVLLASSASGCTEPLRGTASVIDGDTLDVHGTRIRLHGVDAPEGRQTCKAPARGEWRCGQQAANALDDLIGRRPVTCHQRDVDRYGRVVAQCEVGGTSINRWLVRNGWAVAYTQYSNDYVAEEAAAKSQGLNIWSGEFIEPGEYRRTGGRPAQPPPNPGCNIKGNISSKGERIYHSPGQQHYDRTRIDTAAGERWFCSTQEARAAGWRPALR